MKWILIIVFTTVGGSGGVSITSVNGFSSQALCEAGGKKAQADISGVTTWVRYSCVKASDKAETAQ